MSDFKLTTAADYAAYARSMAEAQSMARPQAPKNYSAAVNQLKTATPQESSALVGSIFQQQTPQVDNASEYERIINTPGSK